MATAGRHEVINARIGGFAAFQALLWITYAGVHFAASIPAVQSGELAALALMQGVRALTGGAITSLAARFLSGEPARFLRHALVAAAIAIAWMFLDRVLLVSVAPIFSVGPIPWSAVPRGLDLEYVFVSVAWTAGYVGYLTIQRNAALRVKLDRERLESQAARGEALAGQLNAHFLFNTLNMIRSMIPTDPETAREMITRTSSLLRRVLATETDEWSTVQDEISYIEDYLEIQRARFGSGLHTTIQVAPEARTAILPRFTLQPLVENAFKHGKPDMDGIRRIDVSAELKHDRLVLRVGNSGTISDAGRGDGTRLTMGQLARLHGAAHNFTLSEANGTVSAIIDIEHPRFRAGER